MGRRPTHLTPGSNSSSFDTTPRSNRSRSRNDLGGTSRQNQAQRQKYQNQRSPQRSPSPRQLQARRGTYTKSPRKPMIDQTHENAERQSVNLRASRKNTSGDYLTPHSSSNVNPFDFRESLEDDYKA